MADSIPPLQLQQPTMPIQRTFRKIFFHYLKKNANKPAILLKLMQISKFFWIEEFPFLIVKELRFDYDRWGYLELGTDNLMYENFDGEEVWVTESITMYDTDDEEEFDRDITEFLPNIAVLGLKELCIGHQNLTLKQFKFLTNGPIFILSMNETIVTNENGDIVPVETLLKLLPSDAQTILSLTVKVSKKFDYNDETALTATKESTVNMIKVLKNSKIKEFGLRKIPDTFDFEAFCTFLNVHGKELKIKYCHLNFRKDISVQFKLKLKVYDIQMIKETTDKYYPLGLSFPEQ